MLTIRMPVAAVVLKVAPRAHPNYAAGFRDGEQQLEAAGINTPLRVAHFIAQWAHESGGFERLRESGSYSAARISEIFGVGKHSAAVTPAEAKKLAKDGPALFERVYGLGNPKKAAELGNHRLGDAWIFRGGGLPQLTGGALYRKFGFYEVPDSVTSPARCLEAAIKVWLEKRCNELADRNDIRAITKAINGGYNGYDDRVAWFNKLWPLLRNQAEAPESWKVAQPSETTSLLQQQLATLGYDLKVDGRVGPKTTEAVIAFQQANGLRADGIAGDVTLAAIRARLSSTAPAVGSAVHETPAAAPPAAGGLVIAGVGEVGQKITDQAVMLQQYAGVSDTIQWMCAGLTAVGVTIAVIAIVRTYVVPMIVKPKVVVPA